jgi:hypothetical protein
VNGPVIDEVTTIRPRPDAASASRQACTANTVPLKLVASTVSRSSGLMSSSRAEGKIPAFAHRMSMPPYRDTAVAAISLHCSRSLMSAVTADTSPPAAPSSSTAWERADSSRPAISTLAPAAANTSAMPRPIPLLPPVITTDRPAIEVNIRAPPVAATAPAAAER